MVKTTVYLQEELKRGLSRLARRRGRTEADLIREAVARLVENQRPNRPRLPLFSSSGEATLAERVDEALVGFGE
ncbi:MAG: CopG family transcriptional regulator [Acidobacteria bacterium]|nr:CopG family transcriptional regulator [Acidobacteriota bacterium]